MDFNYYAHIPDISVEEMAYLQQGTTGLTENQHRAFLAIYTSKRRNPQEMLIFTLLGFILIAGVQRFVIGQIFMGIIYVFTGGFCLIGTIVDLINYKTLASDYNRQQAFESLQLAKMSA